jgi:ATP-dependent RNA helicase SUPV3L1/SUV3
VIVGREAVFVARAQEPDALARRALLSAVRHGRPPVALEWTRPSVGFDSRVSTDGYFACGFIPVGSRAVKADRLERAVALAYRHASRGPFVPGPDLASVLGCRVRDVAAILMALGYVAGDGGTVLPRVDARRKRA